MVLKSADEAMPGVVATILRYERLLTLTPPGGYEALLAEGVKAIIEASIYVVANGDIYLMSEMQALTLLIRSSAPPS